MFTHLTWSQFFLYSGLTLLGYYLVTLPFYFRHELRQLFRLGNGEVTSKEKQPAADDVLGPLHPETVTQHDTATIRVAPIPAGSTLPDASLEQVTFLLEEAGPLIAHVADTRAGKAEFLSLLRLITARYPSLAQDPGRSLAGSALLGACEDKLSFELHPGELDTLWINL